MGTQCAPNGVASQQVRQSRSLIERPTPGVRSLVDDVAAVIQGCGQSKAVIVGHDWGGAVAWLFATLRPEMTEKLIVLNLPHPRGFRRELARNPEQQKNAAYAREFQREGAHTNLTAEGLTFWITDPLARPRYIEAFQRSDHPGHAQLLQAELPA